MDFWSRKSEGIEEFMDLSKKAVKHLRFGKGFILEADEKTVLVKFDSQKEAKSFQFPLAFEKFLVLEDQEISKQIFEEIHKLKTNEETEKAKFMESKKEQDEILSKSATWKSTGRKSKLNKKNISIRCNYLNKGDTMDCIQYAATNLTSIKAGSQLDQQEIAQDTFAILTTRTDDVKEEGRVIFAAFMIKEPELSSENQEDYILVNEQYKLALSLEEAKQLPFWEFYFNEKKPDSIRMAAGLHRNLTDIQAAQILKEMVRILQGTSQEEKAIAFLQHFCAIRNLDSNNITQPEGGLVRLRQMWEK